MLLNMFLNRSTKFTCMMTGIKWKCQEKKKQYDGGTANTEPSRPVGLHLISRGSGQKKALGKLR